MRSNPPALEISPSVFAKFVLFFFVVVCKKELNKVYDWFMKQPFNIEGFLIWEEIKHLPKNNRNDKINNKDHKLKLKVLQISKLCD